MRTEPDIQFRINQGVNKQREQTKIFKLENTGEKTEVQIVIRLHIVILSAIEPYIAQNEFTALESKLGNGERSLLKVWVARTFTSKSSTRPTPTPR